MARGKIKIKLEGIEKAQKAFRKIARQAPKMFARTLFEFSEEKIAGPAREEFVPVVTGTLKTSIIVQKPEIKGNRHISVITGAGGGAIKYAVSVHENPRSGKTGGVSPQGKEYKPRPGKTQPWSSVGQWKYLETPALNAVNDTDKLIRDIKSRFEEIAFGTR